MKTIEEKKEYDKQYYLKNKEKYITRENSSEYKERRKKYYLENKQKFKEWNKAYNSGEIGVNRRRDKTFQRKYGITLEDYNTILKKQNHCCKICNKAEVEHRGPLKLDHCHSTGKIRGLLCDHCNRGLGYFLDNIQSLQSAINYLNSFK